jgi:hypothetical protein
VTGLKGTNAQSVSASLGNFIINSYVVIGGTTYPVDGTFIEAVNWTRTAPTSSSLTVTPAAGSVTSQKNVFYTFALGMVTDVPSDALIKLTNPTGCGEMYDTDGASTIISSVDISGQFTAGTATKGTTKTFTFDRFINPRTTAACSGFNIQITSADGTDTYETYSGTASF